MDPNAALRRCRKLAEEVIKEGNKASAEYTRAEEMADIFLALDDWITNKKGFLPDDWKTARA